MVFLVEKSDPASLARRFVSIARSDLATNALLRLLLDAREGPLGRFGDDVFGRCGKPRQQFCDASVGCGAVREAGVPERDAGVTDQAAPFRAFDGTAAEELVKF